MTFEEFDATMRRVDELKKQHTRAVDGAFTRATAAARLCAEGHPLRASTDRLAAAAWMSEMRTAHDELTDLLKKMLFA